MRKGSRGYGSSSHPHHNLSVPDAYLLDLDGTLIDSEPWYKQLEVATLNGFGVPITLEMMEEYTGVTLRVWLERINGRFDKAITVDQFLDVFQAQMEDTLRGSVPLFSDAERFLEQLDGAPAVLVTSSMRWYVDIALEKFPLISSSVRGVVCEADVKRGKPDPEPYLMACDLLKIAPDRAWVIEDAPNGVKSGQAAGCHVVGIDRHGSGSISFADRVVSCLDELVVEPILP